MKLIKLLLFVCVAFFGVTFACLNAATVKVNLYVGTYEIYLSILLVLTLGVGIILGFLTMLTGYFRLKAENYRVKNKVSIVEKELANLRTLPIKDIN